jgi:triosephosphate isomerase
VTPESIDELMKCPDIDGALVGGASLVAKSFARIAMYGKYVSEPVK